MRRGLIVAAALLAAACEPVREAPEEIPGGPATEATTVIIANDAERRSLMARAGGGDGAAAFILSQDTPDPEGERWLERAVQLGWPEARRDKAMRIVRDQPCRLEEARALLAGYRAARTVHDTENAYIDRLTAAAAAQQAAC